MIYRCIKPTTLIENVKNTNNTVLYQPLETLKENINIKLSSIQSQALYPIQHCHPKIKEDRAKQIIDIDIVRLLRREMMKQDFSGGNAIVKHITEKGDAKLLINNLESKFDEDSSFDIDAHITVYRISNIDSVETIEKIDKLAMICSDVYIVRSFLQNPIDETFTMFCFNMNDKDGIMNKNCKPMPSNISNVIDLYTSYLSHVNYLADVINRLSVRNDVGNISTQSVSMQGIRGIEVNAKTEYRRYVWKLEASNIDIIQSENNAIKNNK